MDNPEKLVTLFFLNNIKNKVLCSANQQTSVTHIANMAINTVAI
jgi:hypothetical protein